MLHEKSTLCIEAKTAYLMLENNKTFYCKPLLLINIIADDGLKQHMEIINVKYEDNVFGVKLMEQIIKIFVRSCENKNRKR